MNCRVCPLGNVMLMSLVSVPSGSSQALPFDLGQCGQVFQPLTNNMEGAKVASLPDLRTLNCKIVRGDKSDGS